MTLDDFHSFCRAIKAALDTLPEGSTGVLLLISGALHGLFVRLGVDRLTVRILGPTLAATVVGRLPVLLVSSLWGWLTTGQLTADDVARGLVTGLLGPALVARISRRPPPSDDPPAGSGAPSSSASVRAGATGAAVAFLSLFSPRPATRRAGSREPSSPLVLIALASPVAIVAGGELLQLQGCSPSAWNVELCRAAVRADYLADTERCADAACVDARSKVELTEYGACWDAPREMTERKAREGIDTMTLQEQLLSEREAKQ